MLKNDYYTIPIDKHTFFKILEDIGLENFEVKLYTTISYDKENMEFSSADFQYQFLELKEIKSSNNVERYINYTHYYPENETYHNMEKTYKVEIDNIDNMQNILSSIGFKALSKQIIREMKIEVLEEYYMALKECDNTAYSIEFQTIDNHYITKENYEELTQFLKKYNINHVENVF